jgi:hypothetical protein
MFALLLLMTPALMAQQQAFSWKGHIQDEKGKPLVNAAVKISSKAANNDVVYTTSDGSFRLDLKGGIAGAQEYDLTIELKGYEKFVKRVRADDGSAILVQLKPIPIPKPAVITERPLRADPSDLVFNPFVIERVTSIFNYGNSPLSWIVESSPSEFTVDPHFSPGPLAPQMHHLLSARRSNRLPLQPAPQAGLPPPPPEEETATILVVAQDPTTKKKLGEAEIKLRVSSSVSFGPDSNTPLYRDAHEQAGALAHGFAEGGGNGFRLNGSATYTTTFNGLNARNFFALDKPASSMRWSSISASVSSTPQKEPRSRTTGSFTIEPFTEEYSTSSLETVPDAGSIQAARDLLRSRSIAESPISNRLLESFAAPNRAGAFNNLAINTPALHSGYSNRTSLTQYLDSAYRNKLEISQSIYNSDSTGRGASPYSQFREASDSRSHDVSVNFSRSGNWFSSVGFFSSTWETRRTTLDSGTNPASLGISTGQNDPSYFGLPFIGITGFSPLGAGTAVPYRWQSSYKSGQAFISRRADSHHFVDLGLTLRHRSAESASGVGARGQILFDGALLGNPLAEFLAGLSNNNTSIVLGDSHEKLTQKSAGLSVGDTMTIVPHLRVDARVNYELLGAIDAPAGKLSNFLPEVGLVQIGSSLQPHLYRRHSQIQPQASVTWSPKGDTSAGFSWAHRAAGIDPAELVPARILPNSPNPGIGTNPFGSNPVVVGRRPAGTAWEPGSPLFNSSAPPFDISGIDPKIRLSQSESLTTSFNFRRLRVEYVESWSSRLRRTIDINQPTPGDGKSRDSRRPFFSQFPNLGPINYLVGDGRARYRSLNLSTNFSRSREWGRLGTRASWLISRALDDLSFPQDINNLEREWAPANNDQRHRFELNLSLDLPPNPPSGRKRHFLTPLSRGWSVSTWWNVSSGYRLTPLLSFDNSGTGNYADRPNLVGDPNPKARPPYQYFNRDAFAIPAPGTFGNAPRNSLVGPALNNVDVQINRSLYSRNFRNIGLEANILNVFNRPAFTRVNPVINDPAFGTVYATSDLRTNRRVHVRLRILF